MTTTIAQNDYGFDLVFNLQNYDGTAFDLTDATDIIFYAHLRDSTENKITADLDTVGNPTDGEASLTVQEKHFDQDGDYLGEIEVVFADRRETFTGIIIHVVKNVPRD